jgi:hypothetical protein
MCVFMPVMSRTGHYQYERTTILGQESIESWFHGIRSIHLIILSDVKVWAGQDWEFLYQLLPTFASLLLLLLGSRFTTKALRQRVNDLRDWNDEKKTLAINVAVDWSVTLGVHAAMFSAVVSVFVAASRPPSLTLAAFGVLVVGFLWYVVVHYVPGREIGELIENRPYGPAFWCSFAIVCVNLVFAGTFCANNCDCSMAIRNLLAAL